MNSGQKLVSLATLALALAAGAEASAHGDRFEVWLIDQSNTNGLTYGGKIYIYDGRDLRGSSVSSATPIASIDLSALGGTGGLCFNATDAIGTGAGANPVRPHMVMFNSTGSHAVVSFVASGHVAIFDAASRAALACFRTHAGAGGVRQAHASFPAPDDSYILIANQNGKILERINSDFSSNSFVHDGAANLDLANCTTPNGVACQLAGVRGDNAPICPIIDATSALGFVTLRGGGMFVVDPTTTPISIVAEYDLTTVHGNGCGGIQAGDQMFINSGGATATNRSEFDVYSFPVTGYSAANPPNTPAPALVFQDDYDPPTGICTSDPLCRDSHGMTVTRRHKYLWVADRHRNVFEIFKVRNHSHTGTFDLSAAAADPAPDLAVTSPRGSRIFASTRGPNPLTGDPHVATGSNPGLMVIRVKQGGKSGEVLGIVPISNIDAGGVERADGHGVGLRRIEEEDDDCDSDSD